MRTLLKLSVPVEAGNAAISQNGMGALQSLLDRLRPEAAYFATEQGRRAALIVFDLQDPSEIPQIAEPLFQAFNATVEFTPVMNREDLEAGLRALAGQA